MAAGRGSDPPPPLHASSTSPARFSRESVRNWLSFAPFRSVRPPPPPFLHSGLVMVRGVSGTLNREAARTLISSSPCARCDPKYWKDHKILDKQELTWNLSASACNWYCCWWITGVSCPCLSSCSNNNSYSCSSCT